MDKKTWEYRILIREHLEDQRETTRQLCARAVHMEISGKIRNKAFLDNENKYKFDTDVKTVKCKNECYWPSHTKH